MNTLRKSHKLRHKSLIEPLFTTGERITAYPLRVSWRTLSREELAANFRDAVPQGIGADQILISIPKRKLRHAVDRVRMRRLIREAYRLNRTSLCKVLELCPSVRTLSLGFVFLADSVQNYAKVESKMKQIIESLSETLLQRSQPSIGTDE